MSNPVTQSELNQLATEIRNGFSKLEVGQAEIKGEIKTLDEKLSGQINALDAKVNGLDKRLSNAETSLQKLPELAEKVGEFKWWKQFILIPL